MNGSSEKSSEKSLLSGKFSCFCFVSFLNSGLSLIVSSMDLTGKLEKLVFESFEDSKSKSKKSHLKWNAHFSLDSNTVFEYRGKFNSMTESRGTRILRRSLWPRSRIGARQTKGARGSGQGDLGPRDAPVACRVPRARPCSRPRR